MKDYFLAKIKKKYQKRYYKLKSQIKKAEDMNCIQNLRYKIGDTVFS